MDIWIFRDYLDIWIFRDYLDIWIFGEYLDIWIFGEYLDIWIFGEYLDIWIFREYLDISHSFSHDIMFSDVEDRQYVVLSSRVHPGESNSSWVMKGTSVISFSQTYL